jgi:hypothetical protein
MQEVTIPSSLQVNFKGLISNIKAIAHVGYINQRNLGTFFRLQCNFSGGVSILKVS